MEISALKLNCIKIDVWWVGGCQIYVLWKLSGIWKILNRQKKVLSFGLIWSFSVRFLAFLTFLDEKNFRAKKNHKKVRPQVWLVLWYWSYEIWNLTIISEIYNNQYFFCFSSINAKGSQMWFQQWFMWLVSSCPNPFQNKVRKTFLMLKLRHYEKATKFEKKLTLNDKAAVFTQ